MKPQYYSPIKETTESHDSRETPNSSSESSQDDSHASSLSDNSAKKTFGHTRQQLMVLMVISLATLSAAFSICLFPPFYPRIAEEKGATASVYGFIIGTNCLTSFLVTPFIGNHLSSIGVRFAFVAGMFISGVCCALSGFLEFFPPGAAFIGISIAIRVVHAVGNSACVVSTFTYSAVEFPDSVARIFSWTRLMMSVAQMAGPIVGGALYEIGGFKMPFLVMGIVQTVMSLISYPLLPEYEEEHEKDGRAKPTFRDILRLLCIPAIWIPFMTFIVSTMSNGFLSINLEPKVLRHFGMTPLMVGLFFGLKDGANSVASPIWGYLCDTRGSVRVHIIVSTMLGALSLFLIGPFPYLPLEQTLASVGIALVISGIGFSGQQVAGVVDALRELVHQGFPDSPSTHGLVAGLWTSFSGAGRFISRAGTGILVDHIGFQDSSVIIFFTQIFVVVVAIVHSMVTAYKRKRRPALPLSLLESGKGPLVPEEPPTPNFKFSFVESGDYGQLSVTVSQPSSPVEALSVKSISIPVPRKYRHATRHRAGTFGGYPS